MQHVVCHVEKCKTLTVGLGQHIDRLYTAKNVDRERTPLNENLVPRNSDNLVDDVNRRIAESYKGKKVIRKDAVKAFRIILSGSHDRMKEIEQNPQEFQKWKDANVKFMQERFGSNNLIRMSLHMDETTPHIHAIVVPITKDGRLSAKDFIDGPKGMRDLQTQYAEAMKIFGLDRGKENSTAKHTDISAYYGRVNQQSDPFGLAIPQAKLFESTEKYAQRVRLALSPLQETLENSKRTIGQIRSENYKLKQDNERLEMKNQLLYASEETNKIILKDYDTKKHQDIEKAKQEGFNEGVREGERRTILAINRLLTPEKRELKIDQEKRFKFVPINDERKEHKRDFGINQ